MSADKPRRLGRGLEALIATATTPAAPGSDLQRIPVNRIQPNPFQPRRVFSAEELAELEQSIKASGLLQPLTVRRKGDGFELIAGERRLRAVTNLGWNDVPAIVRDLDDQTMLVLALVENLQRADLNAVEEARGYKRLVDEFGLTQLQVAEVVGKDRTTVTNLLRVLTLPEPIQEMVEAGHLTAGHARALLALTDARPKIELANEIVAKGLSVRETEQRVRAMLNPTQDGTPAATSAPGTTVRRPPAPAPAEDVATRRIEDDLRRYLQTDVQVVLSGPEKGSVRISFYSGDDLDRLLELILRENRRDF